MLQTKNMRIDPELLKRLDHAYYNTKIIPSNNIVNRWKMYHTELLNHIRPHVDDRLFAILENHRSLFYLYGVAEEMTIDEGNHTSERMHANAHTAHQHMKNFKLADD